MKIVANIPVAKIKFSSGAFTFRKELLEVEVVRVMRHPASRNSDLNRWHYLADIKRHPRLDPDAVCIGAGGCFQVNIFRVGMNLDWVPPVFPDGVNVVEVAPEAREGET